MRRDTKILGAFICAASALILGASALCTWAIAHGASQSWRLPFRMVCHGIASRCLMLFGTPMPVCARCTAIYIGLIAGVLLFSLMPWIEERFMRLTLYVATIPIAVDGITQAVRLRESTNSLRLATGFLAAAAFSAWALSEVEGGKQSRNQKAENRKVQSV